MNIRELQAQRAEKIARARQLADIADGEGRDFSEAERAEWIALMGDGKEPGEVAKLAEIVEATLVEREKLRQAEESLAKPSAEAEKPAPAVAVELTRKEFNALSDAEKMAFIKRGGKVK